MLVKMWRNWNLWVLLMELQNGATSIEINIKRQQKIKNRMTV